MTNTSNKKSKNKDIYLNAIENLGFAIKNIDFRLDNVDTRLNKIDSRLDKMDSKIENLSFDIENLTRMTVTQFNLHEKRFDKIEAELKTKATKSDILNLQDKLVSKSEFDKLSLRVFKIENKIKK